MGEKLIPEIAIAITSNDLWDLLLQTLGFLDFFTFNAAVAQPFYIWAITGVSTLVILLGVIWFFGDPFKLGEQSWDAS